MQPTQFDTEYQKLNARQKEAVDTIEGPVMVVAGPGTGKTQILALRIANILSKTDTHPANILAITFTESGAISMRRRLADIIGSPAYAVVINTFHGFCNDIIKMHPEEFPHIIGSVNITQVDQIKILEEIILGLPLKKLRPFGDTFHYIKDALNAINELKREGIDPDNFNTMMEKERQAFESTDDLYHQKGAHKGKMKGEYQKLLLTIEKNEELATIYAAYRQKLHDAKLYDYSDMIMEVLLALSRNKDLLLVLQEEHQYILVDEHQDTNNAQNRILELLSGFHKNPNIFVVGDEKQAIFRFQGASLENFLYFKTIYPSAKMIVLEENYRSTQAILDSADSLLKGAMPLKANVAHTSTKVRLFSFSSSDVENYFLAKDILSRIAEGTTPEEIAVLYRDNRDVFPIARMLEKMNIPFSIESDQNVLEDPEIKKLMMVLRAVHLFGEQQPFVEAMHIDFFTVDPLDAYKIIEYASRSKQSVLQVARSVEILASLGLENTARITDFYQKMASFATLSKNVSLMVFLEAVVRDSGFLSHILGLASSIEKMEKLNGFFDEVKSLVESHKDAALADLFVYLDTLAEHDILIKKSHSYLTKRVRLMTAHKSKGLEFGHVYIVNAHDGHWGNRRKYEKIKLPQRIYRLLEHEVKNEDTNIDDERRLFYVALTRAKKTATITYAIEDANKRQLLPSQFIAEIDPRHIEKGDAGFCEQEFVSQKEILFASPRETPARIKDKEFIKRLFDHNGLSVTALNNYLDCPWHYFYTNLLRVPRASTKHQMYGIAVHGALKDFFEARKNEDPSKEMLIQKFEHYLVQQPLITNEYKESLEKGRRALAGYYDAYHELWARNVLCEFNITGILLTPDIRITGKIDKIEIVDPSTNGVNVVDYKTAKPKTRGEIEGSTKNSEGDIKRQLVFYKLLLDRYDNGKFRMISGDIDFIEPDDKGRYKKERLVIAPEDVSELEALIKKVSEEILSLSFWDKTCDNAECDYCNLRKMML